MVTGVYVHQRLDLFIDFYIVYAHRQYRNQLIDPIAGVYGHLKGVASSTLVGFWGNMKLEATWRTRTGCRRDVTSSWSKKALKSNATILRSRINLVNWSSGGCFSKGSSVTPAANTKAGYGINMRTHGDHDGVTLRPHWETAQVTQRTVLRGQGVAVAVIYSLAHKGFVKRRMVENHHNNRTSINITFKSHLHIK